MRGWFGGGQKSSLQQHDVKEPLFGDAPAGQDHGLASSSWGQYAATRRSDHLCGDQPPSSARRGILEPLVAADLAKDGPSAFSHGLPSTRVEEQPSKRISPAREDAAPSNCDFRTDDQSGSSVFRLTRSAGDERSTRVRSGVLGEGVQFL